MTATAGNAGHDGTLRVCSVGAAQPFSATAMRGARADGRWGSGVAMAGIGSVLKTSGRDPWLEGSNPSPSALHSPPAAILLQDGRRGEPASRMAPRGLRVAEMALIVRVSSGGAAHGHR